MTISIGTSAAPSAWDTHAAWLRQRENSGQRFAAVSRDDGPLPAELFNGNLITRMAPPGMAGVLSTTEML